MRSLWKGVSPNIARNALINAAELASYDQVCHACIRGVMFARVHAGELAQAPRHSLHAACATCCCTKRSLGWAARLTKSRGTQLRLDSHTRKEGLALQQERQRMYACMAV